MRGYAWRNATAALFLIALAGDAQAYCSEPSAPNCTFHTSSFESQDEFSECRRQMERYHSEVEDHSQCQRRLVEEAERNDEEAREELEEATRKTNEATRQAKEEADEAIRKAQKVVDDYSSAVDTFNRRAR